MTDKTQSIETKAGSQDLSFLDNLDALLVDASVTFHTTSEGHIVFIRPIGGGFPLVKAEGDSFVETLRQALALWEVRS